MSGGKWMSRQEGTVVFTNQNIRAVIERIFLIEPVDLFRSMSLNEKYGVPDRSMIDSTSV
jgi:hypothetical protein